uniref:Fibronectin type-III domain-containing protein n=1 Tax=Romanomermis culicivorax TaxID=13658 RepID=A0A915K3U2_ROMCU
MMLSFHDFPWSRPQTTVDNHQDIEVDLRSDRDPDWQSYDSEIPHNEGQRSYSIDLRNLYGNTRYYVRVRAVGTDRSNLCISPSVGFTTQCSAPKSPPNSIIAQAVDSKTVVLTWNHPDRSTWGCPDIWYSVEGNINGRTPQTFEVKSDPRGYRVEYRIQTEPGSQWRLRVQTVNSGGASPWSAEVTVKTESDAYCSPPRLNPMSDKIDVEWTSLGRGGGIVFGYYINYRTNLDPRWQRQIPVIIYRGDDLPYRGIINGLSAGVRVAVRIEVIDSNQRTIYYSPEVVAEITCSAPNSVPANFHSTAPDPRHIRLTWEPYNRDPSACPDLSYELQVLEPRGVLSVRKSVSDTQHVFDARPNQRYIVQIRVVNAAGAGPWSRVVSATTPPAGELITGLMVTYHQGMPVLSWRSVDGVDELVAFYKVEIMHESEPGWKPHSSGLYFPTKSTNAKHIVLKFHYDLYTIPFVGSQRPYSVQMPDLPEGRTVQAHVVVMDQNNGVAYTSHGVSVTVPPRCRSPDRAPTNVRVQPVGIREIRLVWTPLGRNEWNCDRLWYVVKYSADRTQKQGYKNFTSYDSSGSFESEPSTRWTFSIRAENPAGFSPWSTEYFGQTEAGAPGSIRDLRINPLGPTVLLLTWQPPANFRDGISGYDITYKLLSKGLCNERGDREITVSSREPTYNLQGLFPHSRYRISVRAKTNVPGESIMEEVIRCGERRSDGKWIHFLTALAELLGITYLGRKI